MPHCFSNLFPPGAFVRMYFHHLLFNMPMVTAMIAIRISTVTWMRRIADDEDYD
jgi:hypothetical protein